jgi:hypothetical protein
MKKTNIFFVAAGCLALLTLGGCKPAGKVAEPPATLYKVPTVIVYAADAIEPEKKAAEELQTYLTKITGGNYSLQAENKPLDGASAIYVGQTAFARNAGVDFSKYAEEEYLLRTVAPNLIIGGGQPNGTLNGIHHFLSRTLGCRFFTWDCEVIPHDPNLSVPALDLRRTPSFTGRSIYTRTYPTSGDFSDTPEGLKKCREYRSLNFANDYSSIYGRQSLNADATKCHNFYFWVDPREYATSHPEYFSNKKFSQPLWPRNGEGQLCWTNREVWNITLDKLRACIKKDRSELPKWKWPVVYQVSQNDIQEYCQCANCQAAVKDAGGNQSGPLLHYVNFVAESIAKEYPDVKIMTFAYVDTEMPPTNIRPASNVIMQWCDGYTHSDCYRPLTHEFNAKQAAILASWKKLGAKLAVWDYWNMGHPQAPYFGTPRVETMVDAIAPDLRYFAASGVDSVVPEAEFCKSTPQNFMELQYYLGYQLMADVTLPEETLIKEYLAGCYGPAAPAMEEFLTLLRRSVKNEKQPLFYIFNRIRTYTDGAFLEKVYKLLKRAQAAVPPGSAYHRRVQQEMLAPLAVILQNPQYDFFQRTGLKKEDLVAEYRAIQLDRIEQPWVSAGSQKADKAQLEKDIAAMLLDIPVPDHLKEHKQILKFAYPNMSSDYGNSGSIESDPDSPLGKAMVSRGKKGEEDAQHDLTKPFAGGLYPNSFGIYSRTDKRSASTIRTDVPQDEKYHWYKIPAFDFGPDTSLWGFYWRASVNLSSVYTVADGMPDYNIWETWISVKYTGPAYVKGSTQKNGVFLDRVILVKPEESKK